MMTLDEAIQHCKEKMCENTVCAQEHKQLAMWLTELKKFKEEKYKTHSDNEQKPTEWSEKDENLLKLSLVNLIELKDRFGDGYGKAGDYVRWLESIKQRMKSK